MGIRGMRVSRRLWTGFGVSWFEGSRSWQNITWKKKRLGLVETLVALEPYESAARGLGESEGERRLAHTSGPLGENRLVEAIGQEHDLCNCRVRQIADSLEGGRGVGGGGEETHVGILASPLGADQSSDSGIDKYHEVVAMNGFASDVG